ncbi:outer membrane beta-barrel protein [Helicobacter sp. MIT 14-3879]|uniref:outer membrane beta-barrel protein n=1 Tax=Helicobacter sp. MIT 14-3879 TaxID=2040649 RepID=UPI000E1F4937|nr:outer membrane beta-barrel protein [Helicobacter sp. MIT 14-3879]RDU65074.1 hypothetical protein CQA44_01830 [Helicobacter sp. MIT 14-3879]
MNKIILIFILIFSSIYAENEDTRAKRITKEQPTKKLQQKEQTTNKKTTTKRINRRNISSKDRRKSVLTTNKNNIGYRNITISNIYKQNEESIKFFIGGNFGIDISALKYSYENLNTSTLKTTRSASASFGFKGGILSEEKYLGGRFYAEGSYIKIPKFHILTMGLNIDLLINYYQSRKWSLGLFLGLGGGMHIAMFADDELKNNGKVPLSPIGWVNIGLVRFIYRSHSFEFSFRYPYIFASIYKDSATKNINGVLQNQTIGYKFKSDTLLFSYVYNF